MRNLLNHWSLKVALSLGVSLAATATASAQAVVAADRGAALTPFFATTMLKPDWGQTNNTGYTVGVDYTRFIRAIIQPSLELRYVNATGKNVDESSKLGGFKIALPIAGIHPYATMLAGTGHIIFNNPIDTYKFDDSFVYALGGGVEFNMLPSLKVRADFSSQHWDLDPEILTPQIFSVGLAYTIPFGGKGTWVH